jgi:threonyl-tRNA synthetase
MLKHRQCSTSVYRRLFEVVSRTRDHGEIAQAIGQELARAALAGKVDGKLVDTSYRVESDADLAIVTPKSPGAWTSAPSTSHLMAQAVQELFAGAQVTSRPGDRERLLLTSRTSAPSAGGSAAIEKRWQIVKADLLIASEGDGPRQAVKYF